MGRDVVDDLHAGGLELRHRIRRRRLDQVDLAREQRVGAGQRLRHRDQDHLVDLGQPLLVPIVVVLAELGELARHEFCQLERTGAGRLFGKLVPVLAELLILRGARDQEPEHLVGKEGIDRLGRDLDRAVIDLGVARHRRQAGLDLRALALVELRRLLVQHLVEIPDHGIGVELAAVVEFDALAQGKAPLGLVGVRRPSTRSQAPAPACPAGRRRPSPRRPADRRSYRPRTGRRRRRGRAGRWSGECPPSKCRSAPPFRLAPAMADSAAASAAAARSIEFGVRMN